MGLFEQHHNGKKMEGQSLLNAYFDTEFTLEATQKHEITRLIQIR